MKKLLLFAIPLLVSCYEDTPKNYKVEFNSGKMYRVKATGYYEAENYIYFWNKQGAFPKDSVKSITVENIYE